jgi:ABC-type branched-subunit amino acid transport system ATPase component
MAGAWWTAFRSNVGAGEIVGLLGPNGAGKTTTFNMVVGVVKPDEGAVKFQDRKITTLPMHQARAAGHRLSDAGAVGFPQADGRGKHPGDFGNVQAVARPSARCG